MYVEYIGIVSRKSGQKQIGFCDLKWLRTVTVGSDITNHGGTGTDAHPTSCTMFFSGIKAARA